MMTASKFPISVSFDRDNPELVHQMVGALVDMTLTQRGASIDELETAFLGMGEIIDAVVASGPIKQADLDDDVDGLRLLIHHSASAVEFDAGAREIADAAFPALRLRNGLVEIPIAARLDRVDDD